MGIKFNNVPHVCTFLHLKKHDIYTQKTLLLHYQNQYTLLLHYQNQYTLLLHYQNQYTLLLHYQNQYTYMFSDWIERGSSFIKYKNRRSFQNCPSNCYSLFLSSRQFQSTFTNLTVWKLTWEIFDDKETIIHFSGIDDSRNIVFKWFVLISPWNNILDTTQRMCDKKEKLQFPVKCSSVIYYTGCWTFTLPYFIRTAN